MTLERLKARTEGIVAAVDDRTAVFIDNQIAAQDSRLKWYMRIMGFALIVFIVLSAIAKNNELAWLFFCTLHLQIVFVYYSKKLMGLPQWKN